MIKGAEKVLEVAKQNNINNNNTGWTIVSMKEDFKNMYPVANATKLKK